MDPHPEYLDQLRVAYDADVERRTAMTPAPWRTEVVDAFLTEVPDGGEILELGCGTGQLAVHVAQSGRPVEAIDLSPGNVQAARGRGVSAHVASFEDMPFVTGRFAGAFAMNSLLHVPEPALADATMEIRRVLALGAPLLVVVWGGERLEGTLGEHEWLDPPRYFSFYTDEQLLALEWPGFEIRSFTTRTDTEESDFHAQVLTLGAI